MNTIGKIKKSRFFAGTEFSLILIIVGLFLVFTFATDGFFSEYNLTNILKQASIVGIIAVAATLVIISGGIDLSVGSITGMSAVLSAIFMSQMQMPIVFAIILSIAAGGVLGLYNGVIIKEFRITPFIATLGSMTIIRGLIKIISGAKTIVGVDPGFAEFSNNTVIGIPNLAIVWIGVVVLAYLLLRYTQFGRNIYVIGCGEEVAKLSGINLRANIYGIYTVAGILCGIAGVLLTSRINSAVPTGGQGYEMKSIAAAVIGGASLAGGRGSVVGTLLGSLLMVLIDNGGIQMGINPFIMEVSTGALITIAVIIDQFRNRKK